MCCVWVVSWWHKEVILVQTVSLLRCVFWFCLVWLPSLTMQGTLKEKTVENLEKYVVKDVSSLYSSRVLRVFYVREHIHTLHTHSLWFVKILRASVFSFLWFFSVPTRGSCLFSSAEWMKLPRFSWLLTVTTNTLMWVQACELWWKVHFLGGNSNKGI